MSSILETFYILFKSNADDVAKGAKKAAGSTKELESQLKTAGGATETIGNGIIKIYEDAQKAIVGVIAVGAAVAAVRSTLKQTEQIRLSAMETGDSAAQIDAIQRASKRFGGSIDETNGVLKSLNSSILDTAFHSEGALTPALIRLGLTLRDASGNIIKPAQMLDKLNVAFQRIDKRTSIDLGKKMGLSTAMILMLQQTPQAYQKTIDAMKKYGAVSKEEIDTAQKFDLTLNDMSESFNTSMKHAILGIMPTLQKFLDTVNSITEFLGRHKPLVESFFIGAAAAITIYFLPAMLEAAALVLAATWPIIAIVAAVTAAIAVFALLYDDITIFFNGGDSMIGRFIKKWPGLALAVNSVADALKMLFEILKWSAEFLSDMFLNPMAAIAKLQDLAESLFTWFQNKFPNLAAGISLIGDAFGEMGDIVMAVFRNIGKVFDYIIGGISKAINAVSDRIDSTKKALGIDSSQDTADAMQAAKDSIEFASSTPIASQSSVSIANSRLSNNRNSTVTTGDIIIQTEATDAEGISLAVGKTLNHHMKQALYNFDDGVDA